VFFPLISLIVFGAFVFLFQLSTRFCTPIADCGPHGYTCTDPPKQNCDSIPFLFGVDSDLRSQRSPCISPFGEIGILSSRVQKLLREFFQLNNTPRRKTLT